MKNSWKRVAAGALSFAMVAGAMPANVGGFLTVGTGIVASAEDTAQQSYSYLEQGISGSTEITNHNVSWDENEGAAYFSGNSSYLEILGQPFKGKVDSTTGFIISFDAKVESGAHQWARFFDICNMKYESGNATTFYNSARLNGKCIFMNAGNLNNNFSPCLGYSYSQGSQAETRLYNLSIDHTKMKDWHNYKVVVDTNAKTYLYFDNILVGTSDQFIKSNSTDTNTIINNSLNDMGVYENYLIGASMWGPNDGYFKGYMKNLQFICNSKRLIVTPPSAMALTYNKSAQELIEAGVAENGTMKYKLGADGTYSTDIPTAINAGTYTVYYKAVGNDGYEDSEESSVDVTIAKSAPTVTAPKAKELHYTGKAHELVEVGEVDGGTLVYALDNDEVEVNNGSANDDENNRDVSKRIQAESCDSHIGQKIYNYPEPQHGSPCDRKSLANIQTGNIAVFNNVDFGSGLLTNSVQLCGSSPNGGSNVEIWLDAANEAEGGTKLTSLSVVKTPHWGNYTSNTYPLDSTQIISGKHDIYIISKTSDKHNLDYFLFNGVKMSDSIPTATNIGEYKVWYKVIGDANHNDTEADFVTASIGAGIANVTVPDDAVIEGQEATEGVYKLECGKTYTIYSDESLVPSMTAGLDIASQRNKAFGGKTYNYKYTVEFADTITDGTEIAFAHKHAAKAFSTDATHTDLDKVWVYCEGEPSEQAGCVAYLDTNGTYYYGDSPTVADVTLREYFGASAKVTDFYFTKKGDANGSKVSPENMKIGEKYVVNARIAVTIDSKVSNFVINKEIEFAARPLTMCEVFLKNGEKETKLPVRDGAVTVPANTFTYNGEQQKPEIVIRNTVLGTETTLTSADYTDAVEAKTNAGRYSAELTAVEGANYSGSLTVNWSIAKAVADIQITPKDKIVYDGEALDKSDFVFDGKNADLLNEKTTAVKVTGRDITNAGDKTANVKLTFENYKDINKDIPVTISKREVKVTPDADQSMIYGTEEAPVIKVETEKAVDNDEDGAWDTNTGVIPTDIEIDFAPTIDIADFDYAYFMNNAGTYSYKVSDTELKNYTALLEGTSVFTIKPKELTKDMFTIDEVDYTFDSKQKDAPMYVFSDGNYSDKKRTSKLTDNDFEVGGTDHAVLPGSYTLEFSGQGNYTGFVSYDWEIKPIRDYAVSVKIDSKTYDGKEAVPTSFVYKTDDDAKNPVKLPGTKTTYTYYEYDGESVIDEAYVKTLKALDGAPKDAGTYLVETTVTAKGYSLEKVYSTFTINQKEIAVIPNSTSKVFGEADPDLADFTYDESAVAEGDTLTFTGEYALPDYSGNAGVYPFELGTVAVDNDNYKLTINGAYVVNAQELTDANIKIIKECTVTEDGWWYPGDCIKVIGTVDGKEIELVRPVYDEESNTYTNTDFEFISATKTKQNGEFSVQVKGVGNYTGYAEAIVLIHDEDYDQQAAIADGVAVDIADAALKDGIKARFLLTPTLAEDWTVEAYGIIYDKTGAVTDAETAKAGLVLGGNYVTKTCSAKDGTPYALNVTPEDNKDVWAVGYITVRKGAMTTTIYTEPKYGNVTELQAKENVKINLADAVIKDEIKARFVLTPEIAEGWTVKGYGIVYDKTGAVTDAETAKTDLVLGGKYVTKTCSAKDGTAYALNITPTDDNTIWAVGYITVEKDGKTVTLYTEPKYAKVSELNPRI